MALNTKTKKRSVDFVHEFDKLNKKLNLLIEDDQRTKKENVQKETWVSASVIQELTGWSNDYIKKKARKYNMVKTRKRGRFYDYLIESINPVFFKKAAN